MIQGNEDLISSNDFLHGRLGKPEEIAKIICFLVSDDAKLITGENFVVSCGMNNSRL